MTAHFRKTDTVPLTGSFGETKGVSFFTTPTVDDTPLALKLAETLDWHEPGKVGTTAAAELRRLHNENDALQVCLNAANGDLEKDEALLRQALEALEWVEPSGTTGYGGIAVRSKAITALRERLGDKT